MGLTQVGLHLYPPQQYSSTVGAETVHVVLLFGVQVTSSLIAITFHIFFFHKIHFFHFASQPRPEQNSILSPRM
jgi:hypothetical protein